MNSCGICVLQCWNKLKLYIAAARAYAHPFARACAGCGSSRFPFAVIMSESGDNIRSIACTAGCALIFGIPLLRARRGDDSCRISVPRCGYSLRLKKVAARTVAHALALLRASRRRHLLPFAEVMPERGSHVGNIAVAAIGALILGVSLFGARRRDSSCHIFVLRYGYCLQNKSAAGLAVLHLLSGGGARCGRHLYPLPEIMP